MNPQNLHEMELVGVSTQELNVALPRSGRRIVISGDDVRILGRVRDEKGPATLSDRKTCGVWFPLDFQDEKLPGLKDDVSSLLIETLGSLSCWDRQDQLCAVLVSPGATCLLESQADAATSPDGIYGNAVNHGYVLDDEAACVLVGDQREVIGFLHVWSDERRTYDGIVAASHYQFGVQAVVSIDRPCWQRYGARIADLLTKEPEGPLYVFLRARDVDDDSRFMRSGTGPHPADQVLNVSEHGMSIGGFDELQGRERGGAA